jgi:hypothetical protein
MAQNATDDDAPAAQIETILVDADDIIEAMQRNRRDENERRQHVLRISPPFDGRVEASLHVSEDGTYYPPEVDPKPIHLQPEAFVGYESGDGPQHQTDIPMPRYCESRRIARDDFGEDVGDETVQEYHDEAMEMWEGRVRAALIDELTLKFAAPETADVQVAIEYGRAADED